ncbi:LOW QUALITY PROTEIN: thioredoxin-related transmembrane protein 1-like [Sceloporus undulatus]|uniref:LOW QUALITY PROTEIN: thioredoxin-related transmembrane protein 1-like n=1 Tax=Sceloporus undulatus TaxID=8520 RepID=UPI001C4D14E0|nr:LOW QUALITY PROTEIN: thioredoxin-related transmembrane protein 1-like [Sceloporus undulatus]
MRPGPLRWARILPRHRRLRGPLLGGAPPPLLRRRRIRRASSPDSCPPPPPRKDEEEEEEQEPRAAGFPGGRQRVQWGKVPWGCLLLVCRWPLSLLGRGPAWKTIAVHEDAQYSLQLFQSMTGEFTVIMDVMADDGGFRWLFFLDAPCCWLSVASPLALAGRGRVQELSDGSWRELLRGEWMVAFYAPWCGACQNLQPEWESFADWGEDLEINIAKVDVTEQPGLSGRFIITALPTIYHCKDGEFRRYQGPRTKTDFINFISDQEWKSIEPVSSWFGPSSFLMSCMSALFQLSMYIRHCHNYFTEDLGIPPWGSYTIFASTTLFSGLFLGLIMVFLADCICPSKKHRPPQYPNKKKLPDSAPPLETTSEEEETGVEHREPPHAFPMPDTVRQRVVMPGAEVEES